jgi:CMP/dCMP kinase
MTTPAGSSGVVAVDGPAGTGKSTVARGVATRLGARFLDTGAMYRAATWAVLTAGTDLTDAAAVAAVVAAAQIEIGTDPAREDVTVDRVDVRVPIRSAEVTAAVSAVAAVPAVRAHLVAAQQALIAGGPIVVEGRDIGTVVAPDADTKIYLTADARVRADRRSRQDSRGDVAAVARDIDRRDGVDARTNPLRPAPGAITIDTTELTAADVVDRIVALVEQAHPARPA